MTVKELMDMVRSSALDFVSYDRANLKEEEFYGKLENGKRYHSVIHFVDDYHEGLGKNSKYDVYMLLDDKTIKHFINVEEAMEYVRSTMCESFTKEVYTISYADREQFYRRETNLNILLSC